MYVYLLVICCGALRINLWRSHAVIVSISVVYMTGLPDTFPKNTKNIKIPHPGNPSFAKSTTCLHHHHHLKLDWLSTITQIAYSPDKLTLWKRKDKAQCSCCTQIVHSTGTIFGTIPFQIMSCTCTEFGDYWIKLSNFIKTCVAYNTGTGWILCNFQIKISSRLTEGQGDWWILSLISCIVSSWTTHVPILVTSHPKQQKLGVGVN